MKKLVLIFALAVVAAMVQSEFAVAETKEAGGMGASAKKDPTGNVQGVDAPSIKQALLMPRGFDMRYSCHTRAGWSRVFFRDDGSRIAADITVVDIKNVDINRSENFALESCTGEAQLTAGGIMFTGCSDEIRNIFMAYDPGNKGASFKGSGRDCPSIALSPR